MGSDQKLRDTRWLERTGIEGVISKKSVRWANSFTIPFAVVDVFLGLERDNRGLALPADSFMACLNQCAAPLWAALFTFGQSFSPFRNHRNGNRKLAVEWPVLAGGIRGVSYPTKSVSAVASSMKPYLFSLTMFQALAAVVVGRIMRFLNLHRWNSSDDAIPAAIPAAAPISSTAG